MWVNKPTFTNCKTNVLALPKPQSFLLNPTTNWLSSGVIAKNSFPWKIETNFFATTTAETPKVEVPKGDWKYNQLLEDIQNREAKNVGSYLLTAPYRTDDYIKSLLTLLCSSKIATVNLKVFDQLYGIIKSKNIELERYQFNKILSRIGQEELNLPQILFYFSEVKKLHGANISTYTVLFRAIQKYPEERGKLANQLLSEMKQKNIPMNEEVFSVAILCIEDIQRVYSLIEEFANSPAAKRTKTFDSHIAIIRACSERGGALNVVTPYFKKLPTESVTPYVLKNMIQCALNSGEYEQARAYLESAKNYSITPNTLLYVPFLQTAVLQNQQSIFDSVLRDAVSANIPLKQLLAALLYSLRDTTKFPKLDTKAVFSMIERVPNVDFNEVVSAYSLNHLRTAPGAATSRVLYEFLLTFKPRISLETQRLIFGSVIRYCTDDVQFIANLITEEIENFGVKELAIAGNYFVRAHPLHATVMAKLYPFLNFQFLCYLLRKPYFTSDYIFEVVTYLKENDALKDESILKHLLFRSLLERVRNEGREDLVEKYYDYYKELEAPFTYDIFMLAIRGHNNFSFIERVLTDIEKSKLEKPLLPLFGIALRSTKNAAQVNQVISSMLNCNVQPSESIYFNAIRNSVGDNLAYADALYTNFANDYKVNPPVFNILIRACEEQGNKQLAFKYYTEMKERFNYTPDKDLITTILKLFKGDAFTSERLLLDLLAQGELPTLNMFNVIIGMFREQKNDEKVAFWKEKRKSARKEVRGLRAGVDADASNDVADQ